MNGSWQAYVLFTQMKASQLFFSNVIRLIAINLGYKLGFFSLKQPICNDCFNPLF